MRENGSRANDIAIILELIMFNKGMMLLIMIMIVIMMMMIVIIVTIIKGA